MYLKIFPFEVDFAEVVKEKEIRVMIYTTATSQNDMPREKIHM